MKAIRIHEFGGSEVMKLEDVSDPRPGAGEVLVRIKAAGVNPVDTYIRSGSYAVKPDLPYTPGADGAGIIEDVGEGVKGFSKDDRVYVGATVINGTYAERIAVKVSLVHPLPPKVSFAQGAAVNVPYVTAYRALFNIAHAQPAETVLVHGASGGVGVACVQLARAAGLTVIGSAGTERGLALVLEQGAHHAVNHRSPGYVEQIKSLAGGHGINLILEMLSNVNLGKDLTILAPRGRVVVVGSRGPVEINPRDTMVRDASILGMTIMNASEPELVGIHAALVAGLENGTLHPVVGQEIPLAEAARAHEAVMKPGAYGKVVLVA